MTRSPSLNLALTLSLLGLASCGENNGPTPGGTAGDQSFALTALALTPNSWTARAALPGVERGGVGVGSATNAAGQPIVYVFGGFNSNKLVDDRIWAYNVATDSWTSRTELLNGRNMSAVRNIGGLLYIAGGYAGLNGGSMTSRLLAYDPVADRIIRKADMRARTANGITGVINGRLYVLAGRCINSSGQDRYCRALYRYNPGKNTWTTLASAPRSHLNGAGGVISGKFYVAGGGFSFDASSLDAYDPATDSWESLAPMPTPKYQLAVGDVSLGKLYVTGIDGDRNTYAYDPLTNTWTTKASYPPGQYGPEAVTRVTFNGHPGLFMVTGRHFVGDKPVTRSSWLYTP